MPISKLLTFTAAAELLGVDRRTIARAVEAGRLPAVVLHRRRLVPYTAIEVLVRGAS